MGEVEVEGKQHAASLTFAITFTTLRGLNTMFILMICHFLTGQPRGNAFYNSSHYKLTKFVKESKLVL